MFSQSIPFTFTEGSTATVLPYDVHALALCRLRPRSTGRADVQLARKKHCTVKHKKERAKRCPNSATSPSPSSCSMLMRLSFGRVLASLSLCTDSVCVVAPDLCPVPTGRNADNFHFLLHSLAKTHSLQTHHIFVRYSVPKVCSSRRTFTAYTARWLR